MYVLHPQISEAKSVPLSCTGKAIAARLARHHQDVRALLALDLINGAKRLSRRQAAKAVGVRRHRITAAALATADQVELLKSGRLRLRDVRAAHAKRVEMSDAEIIAFIDRVDPNRVLAILDRMTAPEPISTPTIDPVTTQFAVAAE
jgi:hypothetical protein